MAKLEVSNRPAAVQPPRSLGSALESNSESVVPNAEMQDWISKARVSIQEFGGLIPAGDPITIDIEDPYVSDEAVAEEYSDDESGYATAEDETSRDVGSPVSSTTKRQAAQTTSLKMLPGEDTPYGLMAALAIRKNAREKSVEPESSEAVGVASADFFRPSMYWSGVFVWCFDSDPNFIRSRARSQTFQPIHYRSSTPSYLGSRDRLDQGGRQVVYHVSSHSPKTVFVLTSP